MAHFPEINQVPSPYSMLQDVGRVATLGTSKACAKKLSQIIANNVNNRGREIGLRIYVRYYRLVLFRFHRSFFDFLCSQFNKTFNKNFTVTKLLFLSQ